jgi:hypothetical protein
MFPVGGFIGRGLKNSHESQITGGLPTLQPEMYVPSWERFALHSGFPGNCPNLYIYDKPLSVERLFHFHRQRAK